MSTPRIAALITLGLGSYTTEPLFLLEGLGGAIWAPQPDQGSPWTPQGRPGSTWTPQSRPSTPWTGIT